MLAKNDYKYCLWLDVESDRGECHQTPPNTVKESPNLKNSLGHVINRRSQSQGQGIPKPREQCETMT